VVEAQLRAGTVQRELVGGAQVAKRPTLGWRALAVVVAEVATSDRVRSEST
jgi:hypothetical protein